LEIQQAWVVELDTTAMAAGATRRRRSTRHLNLVGDVGNDCIAGEEAPFVLATSPTGGFDSLPPEEPRNLIVTHDADLPLSIGHAQAAAIDEQNSLRRTT
jgi:hypothetical protein